MVDHDVTARHRALQHPAALPMGLSPAWTYIQSSTSIRAICLYKLYPQVWQYLASTY